MKYLFIFCFSFIVSLSAQIGWVQQNSGTTERFKSVFALDQNTVWAAGMNGTIVKTTNGGDSWISQSISTSFNNNSLSFIDSLHGWIAEYNFYPFRQGKVLHTSDGGETWTEQLYISNFLLNSIIFSNNKYGWVVGSNGIMFATTNSGSSWFYQYANSGGEWLYSVYFIDYKTGWTVGDLQGLVYKTIDSGINWYPQNTPIPMTMLSVFFINDTIGWAAGYDGSIIKTTNGGISWSNLFSGVSSQLRQVHFVNENEGWAVGYNGTIIHSIDGGDTWEVQNSGTNYDLFSIHFANDTTGWVVGDNGVILKYIPPTTIVDWCNLQGPPEYNMSEDDSVEIFSRIYVDGITDVPGPGYGILSWIGYNEENTDPATWTNWVPAEYSQDVGGNDEYHLSLSGVSQGVSYYASRFQLNNGDYYYGGYPNGFWDGVSNVSGILTVTQATTINWCNLNSPGEHTMTETDSLQVFAQVWVDGLTNVTGQGDGILAWIGYDNQNTDPATWETWLPAYYYQDIGANDEYAMYLDGLDTGVYYFASRFQLNEGDYYYGGYPDGFWDGVNNVSGILTITPVVSVDEIISQPNEYSLQQNFPNPFNPTTKIRYTIPVTGFTTLKVFDSLGNKVKTLVEGNKSPGVYEVEFNATNLSSGIYYYKLFAGDFVDVKKMILLK